MLKIIKKVTSTVLITAFSFNTYVYATLENYEYFWLEDEIDENLIEYEFIACENDDEVVTANYEVHTNLTRKTSKKILSDEFSDHLTLPTIILNAPTIIVLNDLEVQPSYRNEGIGSETINEGKRYFKEKHPHALMVWIAEPTGERPTSLESICKFYDKRGGIKIFNGMVTTKSKIVKRAYYYSFLHNTKKRTFTETVIKEQNQISPKKQRIFDFNKNSISLSLSNKKDELTTVDIIREYHSMPNQYSLF